MNLDRKFLRTVFCGLVVLALAASANAAITITGSAWVVPEASAQDAEISTLSGLGTANASFQLNALNLNSNGSTDYTLGSFIASGGAGTIVTAATYSGNASSSTPLDFDNPNGSGGTAYSDCAKNQQCGTIFEFTGSAYFTNGETYSVQADDGVTLYVGGTASGDIVLQHTGSESLNTVSGVYNGSTGTESFTFVYAECCGAPAIFSTNLASGGNVPEPMSFVLLGTLLAGVGLTTRRKRTQ